ncbi:AMP-binding protein [Streptomyces sp. NPDC096310]|uniref:class I adenylate-forming enzyme family protein n=1 Tax=Streptomyces sp. NPDC096310 TaxID=3366082 RepID=UPI0037FB4625
MGVWLHGVDGSRPLPPVDPDAPVMLQYTSGTTGVPKGVLLRHRSLVNVAKLTMETAQTEPRPVCVNPLPMFRTAGCGLSTLGPLWLGGCVAMVERFEPVAVLDLIRREHATVLFYVPTIVGALLETVRASDRPTPALRTVMGGADSVPRAVIEAAVVGVPDEKWGETVGVAVCLRQAPEPGGRAHLKAHCRAALTPFKVPQHWFHVTDLPVTPSGKVRRFKLLEETTEGRLDPLP